MEKLIEKIWTDGVDEIIEMAWENWIQDFDSVIFYNPKSNEYESHIFSSSTAQYPDYTSVEVYRLGGNWIANNAWEVDDILDDDEWEKLQEKTDDPDFLDSDQLGMIDVDLSQRILEYLMHNKSEIQKEIIRKINR